MIRPHKSRVVLLLGIIVLIRERCLPMRPAFIPLLGIGINMVDSRYRKEHMVEILQWKSQQLDMELITGVILVIILNIVKEGNCLSEHTTEPLKNKPWDMTLHPDRKNTVLL